jgi:hypothetical protein
MKNALRDYRVLLGGACLIGLGCSVFFGLVFSFGQVPPQARLLDFFIPLIVLIFMTILLRARKSERSFHFWEGLVAGNFMLWLGGLISGILMYLIALYQPFVLDNFVASSIRYLEEFNRYAAENQKMTDLPEQIQNLRRMKADSLILDEFFKKIFYSFLLVPFVSILFRRK